MRRMSRESGIAFLLVGEQLRCAASSRSIGPVSMASESRMEGG
jgi:hypothetical protein